MKDTKNNTDKLKEVREILEAVDKDIHEDANYLLVTKDEFGNFKYKEIKKGKKADN